MQPEVIVKEEVGVDELLDMPCKLILYNDDHNSFDHVIDVLIKVLKKTVEEASSHAYTVHTSGKDVVKTGTFKEMKKYQQSLSSYDLTCDVETD